MLVKYSILAQASGSAGGYTFSRNRSGPYLRNRSIPTNPGSEAQVIVRGHFASLSSAWAGIADSQRTAWALYAANVSVTNRLGDQIFLTGQQMYIRCNAVRLRAGLARVDSGPTVMAGASLTLPAVAIAAPSDTSLAFDNTDAWANEDDGGLLMFLSHDRGIAIEYHKGPYLYAGYVPGATAVPPTSPYLVIPSPYIHAIGNSVFARFIAVLADGRISPEMREGPITVT